MAISSNQAAALVGGSILAKGKTMKVKVLRAFCIAGKPQAIDKIIDVDAALATELISANKAEKVADKAEKAGKE
jgi:hypothetical protein